MTEEIDINEKLKEKHEEMLLNKKKIDIDNIVESLLLFFKNYSDNLSNEIIDRICMIKRIDDQNQEKEIVRTMVSALFDMVNKKLNDISLEKFNSFKDKIASVVDNEYSKKLNQISHSIINESFDYYLENGKILVDELSDEDNKKIIYDYVMKTIYNKLLNKLKDQFAYSIKVIDNNYEENEQIINSISQKTMNKV